MENNIIVELKENIKINISSDSPEKNLELL